HLLDPHRVVVVEVRLLDVAVLDRALLQEHARQPVDERAGDLPLDLRGVDGVPAIGGRDDAMDLDLVAVGHGDLGARRNVAVERHHLRQPAIDTLRRRLAQPARSATALSTARFLGCLVMSLRLNSSGSWPTACAISSMKHSTKIAFWLMLTPRQNPGGTCVLRMAWSISKFGTL